LWFLTLAGMFSAGTIQAFPFWPIDARPPRID
jgi:hypothetical protein